MNQKRKIKNSKFKGNSLEQLLKKLLIEILREWGFEPVEIRVQSSGSQFGKDSITEWIEVKGSNHVNYKWSIEAKNVGDFNKEKQINGDSIRSKAHDIYHSNVPLDCWCIISPFGFVDNTFREEMETDKYPFKTVLWTVDRQIERLISCFPEIYKEIYQKDIKLDPEERARILIVWKKQVIDATAQGKKQKEKFSTKSKTGVQSSIESSKKTAREIETKTVELNIYKSRNRQVVTSKSRTAEGIEKISINEELDETKKLLDNGQLIEAKNRYFRLLGKIEDKPDYEIELSKVYNNMGVIYEQQDNLEEAQTYFRRAIKINQDFTTAAKNLAAVYIAKSLQLTTPDKEKELDKAENILKELQSASIEPVPSVIQLFIKLLSIKDGLKGVESYINQEKYKDIVSKDINILVTLGYIYLDHQLLEKAIKYANQAVSINESVESLGLRARVLLAIALHEDTIPHDQSIDDLEPEFMSNTHLVKAKSDLEKALKIAQEKKLTQYLNDIYYLQNIVLSWLREPLSEMSLPKDTFSLKYMDVVELFRKKEYDASFALLKTIPEFTMLAYGELKRIARTYLFHGQPEIAKKVYTQIEEEAIKRNDVHYWLDLSIVYVLLDDKNNAIKTATHARDIAKGASRKTVFSHCGAIMLRYANEEGGDRLLENALQFEKEFPELPILDRFDADKEEEKIVKIFEDRQRWVKDIKDKYRSSPIHSYYLQKVFKRPYISVWSGRDPEMPIMFTSQDAQFINEIETNFNDAETIVFDYMSLLTLSKLDLLNNLEKFNKGMKISFSLFKKIQEELLQEENTTLRKLWEFLRKTQTIEIVKKIPKRRLKAKRSSKIFEDWLLDTMQLGKGKKTTIVTDDLRILSYLRSEKIKGSNSWIILIRVKNMDLLDERMYSKALGDLAECFYSFISFNGLDLFEIVAEDNYKLTARSYFLVDQINYPGSDLKSFAIVFTQFIKEIWRPGLLIEDKIFWLDHISNVLGQLAQTLPSNLKLEDVSPRVKQVMDTAEDFSNIWAIVINLSTAEELKELNKRLPRMITQPVLAKVKEKIEYFILERIKDLK